MASPLRKLAHQHTMKGNGVSTRQRMSQPQLRFQGHQQQRHPQQQLRHNNPGKVIARVLTVPILCFRPWAQEFRS